MGPPKRVASVLKEGSASAPGKQVEKGTIYFEDEWEEGKGGSTILIRSSRVSINTSGFVETLELRYLSKGRSEFGKMIF